MQKYTCEISKLVNSTALEYIQTKMEKLVCDPEGNIVGIDSRKNEEELMMEELAVREARRRERLENLKQDMREGRIPQREVDSEIDGLSSVSSIDPEFGRSHFDPAKV